MSWLMKQTKSRYRWEFSCPASTGEAEIREKELTWFAPCVLLFCSFVKVNAILCDCLLDKSEQDEISHLKWDELLSRWLFSQYPFPELHRLIACNSKPRGGSCLICNFLDINGNKMRSHTLNGLSRCSFSQCPEWHRFIALFRCLERMQPLHQVTFFGQEPVVRKGNIEPIDISIAQRSSNKKVKKDN